MSVIGNQNWHPHKGMLRINMQFFAEAEGGESGAEGNNTEAQDNAGTEPKNDDADIAKRVQAGVDKQTAELGKKIAALQKELDKQKKAAMSAEEASQYDLAQKEKELAEREQMLLDKENRLLAIKAIKAAGLDDGSDMSLELVDFVMANDEEAINNKVKAFSALVKKFVSAEVDKTFKKNGRNPNGGAGSAASDDDGKKDSNSVAERLGKARADKQKQSNDILKSYIGR